MTNGEPIQSASEPASLFPKNPVLTRVWRGEFVESQHRGAWCMVNTRGEVLDGEGEFERPVFVRSAIKSAQALPLIETGAADRIAYTPVELALACASHNGERVHTDGASGILQRIGLDESALLCGPQRPADPEVREQLIKDGKAPGALHNNCSGKHAGFLTLTKFLDQDPATYLDPDGASQRMVRESVIEMAGLDEDELTAAIDGCSAPTWRFPLRALGTAFARVANPVELGTTRSISCHRLLEAVAQNPVLIAGSHRRLCTDLSRVTRGRLFPKVGGEAVYAVGIRGTGRAIAVKIDDGHVRGLNAFVVHLLESRGFLTSEESAALDPWKGRELKNWAGRIIGRLEICL
ncbi:MAG: L-asparaginase II [Planctomycetota bacterium]|jgi:L-asparaginase II